MNNAIGTRDMTRIAKALESIARELKKMNDTQILCGDCKYQYEEGKNTHYYWCRINDRPVDDTDYCVWAERKDNEQIGN